MKELLPLLESVHQSGKSILLVVDDIEGEALNALVLNATKGILKCCAIRAPEFGQGRQPQPHGVRRHADRPQPDVGTES